jgi:DNA-binding response OmpR family regulator
MSDRPKRILVVDDDDAIRVMLERVLSREKFEVDSARDGYEAIDKLSRNDYATILLDLMMPRIDGQGVLDFLEKHRPGVTRSVIIMTANLPSGTEAAKTAPIFRVLSKPFDIGQLVDNVRDCTHRTC